MNRWFEKYSVSLILCFIGTIFALAGASFLRGSFNNQQKANLAKQTALVTAAQLADIPANTVVAIEGRISERNTSHNGLVVYTILQYRGYECDDEDSSDCEEVWLQTERVTPALWLDAPDGRVKIGNNDYWAFNEPEIWQTTDELIKMETLEYRGFRRGSPVFTIGKVNTNDGVTLNIDFLFGGSREDYLAQQTSEVIFFLLMGAVFGGIGIALIIGAIVAAARTR